MAQRILVPEACSFCCLTGITICCDNDLPIVRGFSGWSDPAALAGRIVVGLDTDVYLGSIALSNIS
jgi:hypothetical protein